MHFILEANLEANCSRYLFSITTSFFDFSRVRVIPYRICFILFYQKTYEMTKTENVTTKTVNVMSRTVNVMTKTVNVMSRTVNVMTKIVNDMTKTVLCIAPFSTR